VAGLNVPNSEGLLTDITNRWPAATQSLLEGTSDELSALPIDHSVQAVDQRGGTLAARARLQRFLDRSLSQYAAGANDPDDDNRSGLSPYLHFGHISAHEVFSELISLEGWKPGDLGDNTAGRREGWWGVSPGAESWLDELVTWRELGYNMTSHRRDYDQFESLPEWAQATLARHERDLRPYVYSLEELAAARTHDEVWNAAQTQLVREGRIHNYLRMLWGKKVLEWSASPRDALKVLIELNNRYALDGRNPNSYSGIFWTLGRYDRPWGPERPIFGTIRYMSSENTRKKVKVREYLRRYAASESRVRDFGWT
jgi:deoxyribodipyrimidine photo-lyase